MAQTQNPASTYGGSFLIQKPIAAETFIPEDYTEEQRMIRDMCHDFLNTEVLPKLDAIDEQEPGLMPGLLEKAGELGLLGAAFPEELGGLGKDFVTATLINEQLGAGHSFAVAMAAHNGIASLPILYYGTEAQKQKYMPLLASGQLKGSYALTEPGAGSDARGGITKAMLTEDGKHYILNGQKIWITNAGFAGIFTVFAKVNGEDFTAFLIERDTPGLSVGEEEHKMGIKGSSTRSLFLEDCKVPAENVLGEIGKGHLIAFNILNIGRLKLCAAALGAAKRALGITAKYAKNRVQFGVPIASFGAIKHKLGEMYIRMYAAESALYRTAKLIDDKENEHKSNGKTKSEAALMAAEEYAIECAILKVAGSEMLDYVVDEGVQIHGGNGYMNDYDISRAYRDSRINRIFEGTNEINRLLILDMFLKRALKGRINLLQPAEAVIKELKAIPSFQKNTEAFGEETAAIENFKKAILLCAGAAVQKLGPKLEAAQEVLMYIADMVIDTFMTESVLLRTIKIANGDDNKEGLGRKALKTLLADAADRIHHNGRNAVLAFGEGDELRMMLLGLKRFTKPGNFNCIAARREIADVVLEREGSWLS